eukprot:TRINITY_DN7553_c2_g1_i1.p1 TRINITY_DN7553_c2_g1~~TRINITY_DN7553_c2_g1_i1.p1  ORF type:complete len:338 (+),score=16.03 TRINITY_DN7553_c2_g1_i1:57-1016(+)
MAQSETTRLFSSTGEMRGFIFTRLQEIDKQGTLYNLRLIQKNEQKVVEKKIQKAKVDFRHIEKFATSIFSAKIKFLEVSLRVWQGSFDTLKYLSTIYLPSVHKIDAKIYPSFRLENDWWYMQMEMREPLIFRSLHLTNYSNLTRVTIGGNYHVEIRDCEFTGIRVYFDKNASVFLTKSKFRKGGLLIGECASVYIDEITIDHSRIGLGVVHGKQDITINNVCVISCRSGILLYQNAANFILSNVIIKDCGNGIVVSAPGCGEIQKANIEGCARSGILLCGGAIVYYASVEFKNNEQDVDIVEDADIVGDKSQFLPLEIV